MNEEDVIRFKEAQKCEGCRGWHKHCKAECCKLVQLHIDPKILEGSGEYIIIKVRPMTPGNQRYYRLRDVRYTRETLRFKKDRIFVVGRNVFYMYPCSLLDENNLCTVHSTSKPQLCKDLTLETAGATNKDYFVTDNCLFKYKRKGGSKDGK